LQAVDRKIEAEEARQQALEGLFKSMLHHLMTAKIRLPKDHVVGATHASPLQQHMHTSAAEDGHARV